MNHANASTIRFHRVFILALILVAFLSGHSSAQSSAKNDFSPRNPSGAPRNPSPFSFGLFALDVDSVFFGHTTVGVPKVDSIHGSAQIDVVYLDSVTSSNSDFVIIPQQDTINYDGINNVSDTVRFRITLTPHSSGAGTSTLTFYWSNAAGPGPLAHAYLTDTSEVSLNALLTSAVGAYSNGKVQIEFKTSAEVNVEGFSISRSSNVSGPFILISDYTTDANLLARGQASTGADYTFTDLKALTAGTYYYRISEIDVSGSSRQLGGVLTVTVDIPNGYALYQNYPNPFNPSTTISFDIKQTSSAIIEVFNDLGERVSQQDFGTVNPGKYTTQLNLDKFASGIYYYRLFVSSTDGSGFSSTKKMILLK